MADDSQDIKNIGDLSSNLGKVKSDFIETADAAKLLSDALKDSSLRTKDIFQDYTEVKNVLRDSVDIISRVGSSFIKIEEINKRIEKSQGLINTYTSDQEKLLKKFNAGKDKAYTVEQLLSKFEKDKLGNFNDQNKKLINQIALVQNNIRSLQQNADLLEKSRDFIEKGNDEFDKTRIKATALSKIFGALSFVPFLKEFMDFTRISEKFQKGFGSGMKEMGSQILSILKTPLFAFVSIGVALIGLIKSAGALDKLVTGISNSLGLSKNSTRDLFESFRQTSLEGAKFSKALDSSLLSITNQAKALSDLQQTLGTNSLLTREMLEDQIMMTKQLGLSEEESAGINRLSLLTKISSSDILQNALKQNTTAISYRKIFSEIAKINAELSVAYKNNPDLIAKAVIQANKLGISLEQAQTISKSLLDFETSISGELESELLLGKQFNFEKARALALDGKSAEAAEELLTQIGGINSLTQMNVIQRERIAAAIGSSAEALSNAAREQAVLTSLGFQNKQALEEQYAILRANNDQEGIARLQKEVAKKEGGELLLQDIARLDLNTRFNETLTRLKEILITIVTGPMGQILDSFSKLISNGDAIRGIFNAIKAAAIAAAIAFTVINPAGAAAAAATYLAGAGAYYLSASTPVKDSIISPSMGTTINTPGGRIKPAANDYIVTTTNPGGLNNDAVVAKMDEMITALKSRGNVYVDTVKSGMAYGMNATTYA